MTAALSIVPYPTELSPAVLFRRLHSRAQAFFLDSAQTNGDLGAWSFFGSDPFLTVSWQDGWLSLRYPAQPELDQLTRTADPLRALQHLLERYATPPAPASSPANTTAASTSPTPHPTLNPSPPQPRPPFTGGAVGFLSYELYPLLTGLPRTPPDDLLKVPALAFGFYDALVAHEHASGRTWLVTHAVHTTPAPVLLEQLRTRLAVTPTASPASTDTHAADIPSADAPSTSVLAAPFTSAAPPPRRLPAALPESNFSAASYAAAVRSLQRFIATGDIYQVNLAQRFHAHWPASATELYHRLRTLNPAPCAAYLDCGSCQLASVSPERFLQKRGRRLETRPIKGTRPRLADPTRDAALRAELLASPKERAELLMIVDLERNDLGRVCTYGSVQVSDFPRLETHPTVHHLVATIHGELRPGVALADWLAATFPGGSISGAPKHRALALIDTHEPHRRHAYTGAIGWLGFDGDADLSIAIRTITCVGDQAYYHVGAGITADSDPAAEYQETLDKGRALHAALYGN